MKKNEQMQINADILEFVEYINEEITHNIDYVARLRTCSAWVYETENWYILKSYSTKIAAIHKTTRVCINFLRWIYDYTSTSAQHISKFAHDYNAKKIVRYYDV